MCASPSEALAVSRPPVVRELGRVDYLDVLARMKAFTDERDAATLDEMWLVEHPPVFTLGQAGRPEHVLAPGNIPLVQSDRGGQVTYHGPGQAVMYTLLDLGRRGLGVKALVGLLEEAVIRLLATAGVVAARREGAPGVYVAGAKVAALGLRVRRRCSYHGVALNVDMDLAPYTRINPCGYPGQPVTSLRALGIPWDQAEAGRRLARSFLELLEGPR
ncbi:MAG: lipoyl(octanoyl) transferase LipB [Gammaproteobacteria bacterium]|nr:lipoyl(octanoyl) transferase LipB [Gammaproteobacteria bacterium]